MPDTPNHALSSRVFDVIYIAGDTALYKFFPTPGIVLLWKSLAVGQVGYMLGLGARVAAPAEFIWITDDINPVTAYHYKDGVWTARPLPPAAAGRGVQIVADPFNASRWLAIITGTGGIGAVADSSGTILGTGSWAAYSPLWETEDAGVTWTSVTIATPAGLPATGNRIQRATFSDQTGNQWTAALWSGDDYYTALLSGTHATVSSVFETTDFSAPGIVSGAEGENVLVDVFNPPDFNLDYLHYMDTGGAEHQPAGSSPGNLNPQVDRLPGTSRAVLVVGFDDGDLFLATDYRAAQPTTTSLTSGVTSVSCGVVCTYYIKTGDLYRLADPLGAFTSTLVNNAATFGTEPRVDRQTRTRMAISLGGGAGESLILSDDGAAAVQIAGPPVSFTNMSVALECVVRP